VNLICTNCKCILVRENDKLLCRNCHLEYKKNKEIFSFTDINLLLSGFNNEYKNKSILFKILVSFSNRVTQVSILEKTFNTLLLGITDRIINYYIPLDWATGLLIALKKVKVSKYSHID